MTSALCGLLLLEKEVEGGACVWRVCEKNGGSSRLLLLERKEGGGGVCGRGKGGSLSLAPVTLLLVGVTRDADVGKGAWCAAVLVPEQLGSRAPLSPRARRDRFGQL